MDDRVKSLLDQVRETAVAVGEAAGFTARYAGRCAGQMVDVAKLNMRIFDLNSECNELLQAMGQVVYDTHLGRDTDDSSLSHLLALLDDKRGEVEELKARVAVLRNTRTCPACSAPCGGEDRFCKSCGVPLRD